MSASAFELHAIESAEVDRPPPEPGPLLLDASCLILDGSFAYHVELDFVGPWEKRIALYRWREPPSGVEPGRWQLACAWQSHADEARAARWGAVAGSYLVVGWYKNGPPDGTLLWLPARPVAPVVHTQRTPGRPPRASCVHAFEDENGGRGTLMLHAQKIGLPPG